MTETLFPADILAFWRDAGPTRWFGKDAAFDDAIRVLATEGRLLVIEFAAGGGIPTVKVNRLLLRNVSVVATEAAAPAKDDQEAGSAKKN